jgi:type IV secretory pathway VirB10-like protein
MASTLGARQRGKGIVISLWLSLSVGLASCAFPGLHHKKPRAFNPPPVAAKPIPPPQPAPTLALPNDDTEASADLPAAPESLPRLPGPPVPPPKAPVAAAKPAAQPPAPTPDPVAPPKLRQIYTAAQVREYNRTIEDSLDRVRRVLMAVSGKNLTPEQSQIAESIRTFQRQAESARDQDLVTAVSLARRADLLAKDLIARLP